MIGKEICETNQKAEDVVYYAEYKSYDFHVFVFFSPDIGWSEKKVKEIETKLQAEN